MKKALIAIITLGLMAMAGCASKQNRFGFDQSIKNGGVAVLVIKADGSAIKTATDQKANGELSLSETLDAIKEAWPSADKATDLLDKIADPLKDTPAAVNPAGQGEFEEVE